jgi:hypothetical protein
MGTRLVHYLNAKCLSEKRRGPAQAPNRRTSHIRGRSGLSVRSNVWEGTCPVTKMGRHFAPRLNCKMGILLRDLAAKSVPNAQLRDLTANDSATGHRATQNATHRARQSCRSCFRQSKRLNHREPKSSYESPPPARCGADPRFVPIDPERPRPTSEYQPPAVQDRTLRRPLVAASALDGSQLDLRKTPGAQRLGRLNTPARGRLGPLPEYPRPERPTPTCAGCCRRRGTFPAGAA